MDNLTYLGDLAVIMGVAVVVVAFLHRFGIPSIAGFIVSGLLVGPHVLGLVGDIQQVELLAEIGVVLLLFGIGMELDLDRVKRLWRPIIIGGTLQVGLTIIIALITAKLLSLPTNAGIVIGCLIAVSSTAIVLRGLEVRREIDAPHGRLTLGILIFQDLAVVPIMLIIPVLGSPAANADWILRALLESALILIAVLLAARLIVPRVLHLVAATRQRPLFVLAVLLVCIGTAWAASSAGVSLALGAFLAGMVVAGSGYRHQAIADVIPFREVFSSIFFISIGMLLSPRGFLDNALPILLILIAILIGKSIVVFATGILMRLPLRISILAAVALAQVGEFSFVISKSALEHGLLSESLLNIIIPASIVSMFIAPLALAAGPRLAAGIGKVKPLTRLLNVRSVEEIPERADGLRDHVIIGGYGFAGERLAAALGECRVPYIVIDLNPGNVARAAARGEPAYYGDITSAAVLSRLGVENARVLVLVINDPGAIERATKSARSLAPGLHIIVRTNYLQDIKSLLVAGADEIVPAELEAAVEITSKIMEKCGVAFNHIEEHLGRIRRFGTANNERA